VGVSNNVPKIFFKEESEAVYAERKISFQRPEKSGIPELDLI
jgi:hypothetical protein